MTFAIMNVDFIPTNERDLCDLIQAMRLDTSAGPSQERDVHLVTDHTHHDFTCKNDVPSSPTSSSSQLGSPPLSDQSLLPPCDVDNAGCTFLQSIQSQLRSCYATTGGEYLESILMHRDLVLAYPQAHKTCALGWTNIAEVLDRREWRADREGDREAANAFRYEAWWLASWL